MAFSGYFIKIGGTIFPNRLIQIESYKATPKQQIDLDTYTDADGYLHRNVLSHTRSKIEFNSKDKLSLSDKIIIQGFFPDRKTVTVEYWNDETNTYTTGTFYVPDITFEPRAITSSNIFYKPVRIAFIEY